MVKECRQWGLHTAWVSADSWYASIENLKLLRNKEVGFLVGSEANLIVSSTVGSYEQVGKIEVISADGLLPHLKGVDFVKVFRTVDTDDHLRHYYMYWPNRQECEQIKINQFKQVKASHWNIETCFCTIKQQCHAQDFFVRTTKAIRNHIFFTLPIA